MKVEDTLINKRFYDFDEGDCFVDEYGIYYIKIRDHDTMLDGSKGVVYKAVNLENGCVCEFDNEQCYRPVNAKVVIE